MSLAAYLSMSGRYKCWVNAGFTVGVAVGVGVVVAVAVAVGVGVEVGVVVGMGVGADPELTPLQKPPFNV